MFFKAFNVTEKGLNQIWFNVRFGTSFRGDHPFNFLENFINILNLEAVARRCSVKKVFLEISQNSQENICARVSFLIKLQILGLQLYQNRDSGTVFSCEFCDIFKNTFSYRTPPGSCFYKWMTPNGFSIQRLWRRALSKDWRKLYGWKNSYLVLICKRNQ